MSLIKRRGDLDLNGNTDETGKKNVAHVPSILTPRPASTPYKVKWVKVVSPHSNRLLLDPSNRNWIQNPNIKKKEMEKMGSITTIPIAFGKQFTRD